MNDSTSTSGIETDTEVNTEESHTETIDTDVEDSEENLDEGEDGYTDDDEDADEDVPEYREYDFGGKKHQINKNEPMSDEESEQFESYGKGLQSDYTKKTQELAEHRKHIEAREQSVEKLLSLHGETLDIYSKGLAMRQEIAQLKGIDLDQLWQSNPDQARQVSDAISQKTREFHATVQQVSDSEGHMAHTQQVDRQAREIEGEKTLNARIPQFTEKVGEVIDYFCKTFGADKKATEAGWRSDPVVTELAYKAMMFDKMKAKVKKGSKVNPATATESKPVKGKGGRHKSNTPTDKDSAKDWLAKRNAQLRKRTGQPV